MSLHDSRWSFARRIVATHSGASATYICVATSCATLLRRNTLLRRDTLLRRNTLPRRNTLLRRNMLRCTALRCTALHCGAPRCADPGGLPAATTLA
jgi:hypothetical protein